MRGRKKLTEIQKLNKRELILNCFEKLLAEKTYAEITISDISKLSGLSNGSMYNFFKNKDSIFFNVFLKIQDAFHHFYIQDLKSSKAACDDLYQNFESYYSFFKEHQLYLKIVHMAFSSIKTSNLTKSDVLLYQKNLQRQNSYPLKILETGMQNKEIIKYDPTLLLFQLQTPVQAIIEKLILSKSKKMEANLREMNKTKDDLFNDFLTRLLDGIKYRKNRGINA